MNTYIYWHLNTTNFQKAPKKFDNFVPQTRPTKCCQRLTRS